jgi:hypothetical protein
VVKPADFKGERLELVRIDAGSDVTPLYNKVDERTVLVVEDIKRHPRSWRQIVDDERTGVTFDLYYCGIVMFDKKRTKHHYIINF